MTEADVLLRIADVIRFLASAVQGLTFIFMLMVIFKDMNGGSAIRDLAKVIKERI